MEKPKVGDKVKLIGDLAKDMAHDDVVWTVNAVHDSIDVWWDTAAGESKVALMDALEEYGPETAATAEWYAEIDSDEDGSMAIASFEVEPA